MFLVQNVPSKSEIPYIADPSPHDTTCAPQRPSTHSYRNALILQQFELISTANGPSWVAFWAAKLADYDAIPDWSPIHCLGFILLLLL